MAAKEVQTADSQCVANGSNYSSLSSSISSVGSATYFSRGGGKLHLSPLTRRSKSAPPTAQRMAMRESSRSVSGPASKRWMSIWSWPAPITWPMSTSSPMASRVASRCASNTGRQAGCSSRRPYPSESSCAATPIAKGNSDIRCLRNSRQMSDQRVRLAISWLTFTVLGNPRKHSELQLCVQLRRRLNQQCKRERH